MPWRPGWSVSTLTMPQVPMARVPVGRVAKMAARGRVDSRAGRLGAVAPGVPAVPQLTLVPLTDADYADFVESQVTESARQRVHAGEWAPAEALDRSRAAHADLLGDRLRGRGHVFLKGVDAGGAPVGWLWVGPAPAFLARYGVGEPSRVRWLYQITVREDLRGRGYGRALLEVLHGRLAAEGVEAVYLRVYDWNAAACRLYARCGYEVVRRFVTDAHLRKRLPTPTC